MDFICAHAVEQAIYFRWRPTDPDPADALILEVAVAGGVEYIVTYNTKNFRDAKKIGIRVITPQDFLRKIGDLP